MAAVAAAVTVTRAGLRAATAAGDGFDLSSRCPPSFERVAGGVCELRDLYQFYDSLQDRGVGGTRTALPHHRDGFRPEQIDLGRYLFFDPILSGDGTLSCGANAVERRVPADVFLGCSGRLAGGAGAGSALFAARDG